MAAAWICTWLGVAALGAGTPAAAAAPTGPTPARATAWRLPLIVGGQAVDDRLWPATGVVLYTHEPERGSRQLPIGAMLCTATLIAPDVVVLAAHCRRPQLPAGYPRHNITYFFSQASDVSTLGPQISVVPTDALRPAPIVVHPAYEPGAHERRVSNADDVALGFLTQALPTEPARIPSRARAAGLLRRGKPATIVGYGRNQDVFYSAGDDGRKMAGDSSIAEVGEHELEIGLGKEDAYKCFGDSGGPTFVADASGAAWMVGVTSRGAAVAPQGGQSKSSACRRGAIDTRLDVYTEWFAEQMREACDSGLRPACQEAWRHLPTDEP